PQLHSVKRQVNVVSTARRMHLSRGILAAHLNQQILYVEKQVLASAVVTSRKDRPAVQPFDRGQTHARVAFGDNALPAQHQRVRRVNLEKRSEKMLLGVLEVHCQHGFGINRGGKSFGSRGRQWRTARIFHRAHPLLKDKAAVTVAERPAQVAKKVIPQFSSSARSCLSCRQAAKSRLTPTTS